MDSPFEDMLNSLLLFRPVRDYRFVLSVSLFCRAQSGYIDTYYTYKNLRIWVFAKVKENERHLQG